MIDTEVVGTYRGYELVKYTSVPGQVIYNANSIDRDPKLICCVADTLEELKKEVDKVWELVYSYKRLEYQIKARQYQCKKNL